MESQYVLELSNTQGECRYKYQRYRQWNNHYTWPINDDLEMFKQNVYCSVFMVIDLDW